MLTLVCEYCHTGYIKLFSSYLPNISLGMLMCQSMLIVVHIS